MYVSIKHKEPIIDIYFKHLEDIFIKISDCQNGRNIDDLLESPICHSGFERLKLIETKKD